MVTSTSNTEVLPPTGLAHVVLRTSNYKPMVAFYKAFLGAYASFENEQLAFLTYDEEHHRIAIGNVPGTSNKIPTSAGLEHIAFQFKDLDHLLTAYQQRKARGILPIWCVSYGPTTSIYYQDPDGNQLETRVDNFDTVEAASAMMASPEFAENPLGVDFDPDDVSQRLRAGESEASIKKRENIGPRGLTTYLFKMVSWKKETDFTTADALHKDLSNPLSRFHDERLESVEQEILEFFKCFGNFLNHVAHHDATAGKEFFELKDYSIFDLMGTVSRPNLEAHYDHITPYLGKTHQRWRVLMKMSP
ncbi:Glyoxalase/Bleomycin resistance protein/dihydroxybiphenyl dioxygenase [Fusarium bulbicola]|nr:Glyoxalase/Bleomycin resistance protein/dihydroxybiphenyl dioxygenase [Fusarium bulbicola]